MKLKQQLFYFIIAFVLNVCMLSGIIAQGAGKSVDVIIKKLKVEYNWTWETKENGKVKNVPGCVIDGKAYVKLIDMCIIADYGELAFESKDKRYIIVGSGFNWKTGTEKYGYVQVSKDKNNEYDKTFNNVAIQKLTIEFFGGATKKVEGFLIDRKAYVKLADFVKLDSLKADVTYDKNKKKYVVTYKDEVTNIESATPNPTATPTPKPTTTPKQDGLTLEEQVVELVNQERAKKGVDALIIEPILAEVAAIRAKEIRSCFNHTRLDGTGFRDLAMEFGFTKGETFGMGENIAGGSKTPEDVVRAWMGSPGHKKNILDPDFVSIGVGYYHGDDGYDYWVQIFYMGY